MSLRQQYYLVYVPFCGWYKQVGCKFIRHHKIITKSSNGDTFNKTVFEIWTRRAYQ